MKKRGILNSKIDEVLSKLGHTDLIMIADCGLPIPDGVTRVDLALKPGSPNFLEVYNVILEEFFIEKQFIAKEMLDDNQTIFEGIDKSFETKNLTHEELKELSTRCKMIIRTGEITPYANIILQSGVNFKELYENTGY